MTVIDKILSEWSYRCSDGIVDLNNSDKVAILEEIMGFTLNEGVLKWSDFSDATRKYYRLSIINKKIKDKSPFELKSGDAEILTYADEAYADLFANEKVSDIKAIGSSRINQFPFFQDSKGNKIGFTSLNKTSEFGGKGSKEETTERQERGLIDTINSVPGPKTLISENGITISDVVKAEKIEKNEIGSEPYADIRLIRSTEPKEILISAKGTSSISIGGGGLKGISSLVSSGNKNIETFIKILYKKAYNFYQNIVTKNNLQDTNLYRNGLIKDVSIEIPQSIIKDIIVGTKPMGGPVDYYYIGEMDVKFTTDEDTIYLLNGELKPVEKFIEGGTFYANIIKRDGDIYFTTSIQNINGLELPRIFEKKKESNSAQSRFIISSRIRGIELKLTDEEKAAISKNEIK